MGCYGGWYFYAWDYMKVNALESEADYPYTSGNGVTGHCMANASLGKVKVTGYT